MVLWRAVNGVMDEHRGHCYPSLASSELSDSPASPTLADTVSTNHGYIDDYEGSELESM